MRLMTLFVVVFVGVVAVVVWHFVLVGFVQTKRKGSRYERLPGVILRMCRVRPLGRGGRKRGYREKESSSRSAAATMWNAKARMSVPFVSVVIRDKGFLRKRQLLQIVWDSLGF